MKSSNPAVGLAAVAALAALVVPVQAQDYPARPIRIVLPFSPGGGTDLLARLLSKRFYEAFGQTATVDNRPGAGGNLGADIVAKSAPDGYTLLMSTASLAVNVTLYSKLPYDLRRDFIPITQVASAPLVVTVHPSVPARSVKEFVALAKKTRSGLNFGSNGTGTTSHLALVMMAPKGTPASVIAKLDAEFKKALAAPDVRARLATQSADVVATGTREFSEMIKRDTARWVEVVKVANIKIE